MKSRGALARVLRWAGTRRAESAAGSARDAADWNREYAAGRWDYLEGASEQPRHSVLAGYVEHFGVAGAVLDVGCGTGMLFPKLHRAGCRRYVGVDLSSEAIAQARTRHLDGTANFIAADGQEFSPEGRFDCVIFNEVLYFFRDPPATVARYAACLAPRGLVLVSTCTAFRGGVSMLESLKATCEVLDETRVTAAGNDWSWILSVLRPKTQGPADGANGCSA